MNDFAYFAPKRHQSDAKRSRWRLIYSKRCLCGAAKKPGTEKCGACLTEAAAKPVATEKCP